MPRPRRPEPRRYARRSTDGRQPARLTTMQWTDPRCREYTVTLQMTREQLIWYALRQLRLVRDTLKTAQARQAQKAVARAVKSVEGATRHVQHHGWKEEI